MKYSLSILAFAAVAACGRSPSSVKSANVSDGLSADLQLASHARDAQVVVSSEEVAPTSAPKRAEHKRIPKPSPQPTERVASQQAPVPQPAPSPVVSTPAPSAPSPAPAVEAPKPQPVQQAPAARQPGVYSTEAEVFSKMPWIRP